MKIKESRNLQNIHIQDNASVKKGNCLETGITLVALIITIVIMIILLGVTEIVIPDDVFKKADNAQKSTVEMTTDAQNKIDEIKASVPEITNDIVK